MTTVIALGGNALVRDGERGTAAEQLANLRSACTALAPLLSDQQVVVTHGNGPQVGNELLRQERGAEVAPPLPLYVAVAQTQAEIGTLLAAELRPVAGRPVACVLTHVEVADDDPALSEPTKPVGPFYSEEEARRLESERGWSVVSDAGRGWRRVVASPAPLEIVELESIRALAEAGDVVIACGGGGIPVVRRDERLKGIDAVIDKDRASAVLAAALGAERLVIVTDVPALYRDFGGPGESELRELTVAEAEALLPELAAGSMRPKLEAALAFARTGGETLIASAESLADALEGNGGTHVRPSS
ncbi:MAG: carbamate kinase [Actinomycetota bacterium]|nr:carbamate kinase [Actinomycetota bacterium]